MDIKGAELDFLAMTGNSEELKTKAAALYTEYQNNIDVINTIGLHLVNNGYYEEAQPMIEHGLSIKPDNFDLIQLMAFRYYYAAEKCQKDIENMRTSSDPDKFKKIQEIQTTEKSVLENAHIWLEKGYAINQNDRSQNIMSRSLQIQFGYLCTMTPLLISFLVSMPS